MRPFLFFAAAVCTALVFSYSPTTALSQEKQPSAANLYIVLSPFHEASTTRENDEHVLTFRSLMPTAGWKISCDSVEGPAATGGIEVRMTVAAPPKDADEVPTAVSVTARVPAVDMGKSYPLRIWWRSGSSDYALRALYTFHANVDRSALWTYAPQWGPNSRGEGLAIEKRPGAGAKFDIVATVTAPQGGYDFDLDKFEPPSDKGPARILTTLSQGGRVGITMPVPVSVKCPFGALRPGTFELELLARNKDNDNGYGIRGRYLLSTELPAVSPSTITQDKRGERDPQKARSIDSGSNVAAKDLSVVRCDFDVADVYKEPNSHTFVFDGRKMLPAGTEVTADPVEEPDASGRLKLFLTATPPVKPKAGMEQMRLKAPLRSLLTGAYCLEIYWRDGAANYLRVGAFHLSAQGPSDPNQQGCVGGVARPAEVVRLHNFTRRNDSQWRSPGVAKYTGKGAGAFDLELTLNGTNSDFDYFVKDIDVLDDLGVIRILLTEKQLAEKKPLRDPYRQAIAKVKVMRAMDYVVQVYTNRDYQGHKTDFELVMQCGVRGIAEK